MPFTDYMGAVYFNICNNIHYTEIRLSLKLSECNIFCMLDFIILFSNNMFLFSAFKNQYMWFSLNNYTSGCSMEN